MVVTVLAVLFLLFIVVVAYFGYRTIITKKTAPEEINTEKCSICRERFDKSELVLRQIGDYRLFFFCRKCILSLYSDIGLKN